MYMDKIKCCGTIKEWRIYAGASGTLHFQVWRQSGARYKLIGLNVYSYSASSGWYKYRPETFVYQHFDLFITKLIDF